MKSRGTAPLISNLGTRYRRGQLHAPAALPSVPTEQEARRARTDGLGAENGCGITTPDRSACSLVAMPTALLLSQYLHRRTVTGLKIWH